MKGPASATSTAISGLMFGKWMAPQDKESSPLQGFILHTMVIGLHSRFSAEQRRTCHVIELEDLRRSLADTASLK